MLVWLKEPMGYTALDGHRVYGKKYCYGSLGPTDLPRPVYDKYRSVLEDAPYGKDWLEDKFGRAPVAYNFTIEDIKKNIDDVNLLDIADYVGVVCIPNKKRLTIKERHAIRKSIIYMLNT